jgi:hypothetical protein
MQVRAEAFAKILCDCGTITVGLCTTLSRSTLEIKIAISRGALYAGPASETVHVIVILEVDYILFQCFSRAAWKHAPLQPSESRACLDLYVAALQRQQIRYAVHRLFCGLSPRISVSRALSQTCVGRYEHLLARLQRWMILGFVDASASTNPQSSIPHNYSATLPFRPRFRACISIELPWRLSRHAHILPRLNPRPYATQHLAFLFTPAKRSPQLNCAHLLHTEFWCQTF